MARSITIRDVPDDTGEELVARAARSGRSLQEYLRAHLIELAGLPDPDVVIDRARARKDAIGTEVSPDAVLAARDAERR